jgi:hypothetical protein
MTLEAVVGRLALPEEGRRLAAVASSRRSEAGRG